MQFRLSTSAASAATSAAWHVHAERHPALHSPPIIPRIWSLHADHKFSEWTERSRPTDPSARASEIPGPMVAGLHDLIVSVALTRIVGFRSHGGVIAILKRFQSQQLSGRPLSVTDGFVKDDMFRSTTTTLVSFTERPSSSVLF